MECSVDFVYCNVVLLECHWQCKSKSQWRGGGYRCARGSGSDFFEQNTKTRDLVSPNNHEARRHRCHRLCLSRRVHLFFPKPRIGDAEPGMTKNKQMKIGLSAGRRTSNCRQRCVDRIANVKVNVKVKVQTFNNANYLICVCRAFLRV